MDSTVGFGILGTGSIAGLHRQALLSADDDSARLVALGHYAPERVQQLQEEFGVPCLTEEELLAREDIDAVSICTPSGQHARQAVAAARAGKHVLVEKPMALTLQDADTMIEACDRANVRLGVTLQRRTEEPFRSLGAAVEAGELGKLLAGSVTVPYYRSQEYYDQAAWRGTREMDGGALMNQGIHFLDLLVWYMGDPVSALSYARTLVHDIEAEDTLAATLSFPGGALATINATTAAAPGFPHRIEIYGTRGGVQVEGETIKRWDTASGEASTFRASLAAVESAAETGAGSSPTSLSIEGHAKVYQDFVRAIREDRALLVDGREGRRSLAAVLMIYANAGL